MTTTSKALSTATFAAAKNNAECARPQHGYLHGYRTGEIFRFATEAESVASQAAAIVDGGAGVILVSLPPWGETRCYVR